MLTKEDCRLLRFLDKEDAKLPWPSSNERLHHLINVVMAKISGEFEDSWGGRMNRCVRISITPAGRAALTETEGANV